MQLKRYVAAALVLLALTALIVAIGGASTPYTVSFFGLAMTFPVVFWAVAPAFVLFIASVFHMAYYGTVDYFQKSGSRKELDNLVQAVADALLEKPAKTAFKATTVGALSSFLSRCTLTPPVTESGIGVIDDALALRRRIIEGEAVDPTRSGLDKAGTYGRKALENRLAADPRSAEAVLKSCGGSLDALCAKAAEIFCTYADARQLAKVPFSPSKEAVFILAGRMESAGISIQTLGELAKKAAFGKKDYLILVQMLQKFLAPDALYEAVSYLMRTYAQVDEGYVYLLLDLEMTEKARDVLKDYAPDEFFPYRLYLDEKQRGSVMKLSTFLARCAGK